MRNTISLYWCKFSKRRRVYVNCHVYCLLLDDYLFHTWTLSSRPDILHYNVPSLYHISRGLHKSCCSSANNYFCRVSLGNLKRNVYLFVAHMLWNYKRLFYWARLGVLCKCQWRFKFPFVNTFKLTVIFYAVICFNCCSCIKNKTLYFSKRRSIQDCVHIRKTRVLYNYSEWL